MNDVADATGFSMENGPFYYPTINNIFTETETLYSGIILLSSEEALMLCH